MAIDLTTVHAPEGTLAVLGIDKLDKCETTPGPRIVISLMIMIDGKINVGQGPKAAKDLHNVRLGHLTGQTLDMQANRLQTVRT